MKNINNDLKLVRKNQSEAIHLIKIATSTKQKMALLGHKSGHRCYKTIKSGFKGLLVF